MVTLGQTKIDALARVPLGVVCVIGWALTFVVTWLFVPVRFESNDDTVMMLLANGAISGAPSPNLVFINYFLGEVLSGLYRIAPGIDWYPGVQLLAMSACCGLVLSAMVQGLRTQSSYSWINITSFLALGLVLLNMMALFQFTMVAGISVVIGSWSILVLRAWKLQALGAVLVLFGMLMRFEAAGLVLVVGAPLSLLAVFLGVSSWLRMGVLGAVFIIGGGLHLAGEHIYQIRHQAYTAYNEIRGQLNDNPNAELAVQELPVGVSQNDYQLVLDFFADPTQIDIKKMQELRDKVALHEQRLGVSDWAASFAGMLTRSNLFLVLAALIFMVAIVQGRWSFWLVLAAVGTLVMPLLYVSVFAFLKERVLVIALAATLAGLFYLPLPVRSDRGGMLVCLPLLVLSGFLVMDIKDQLARTLARRADFHEQVRVLDDWGGVVINGQSYFEMENARLFTDDLDKLKGRLGFSGWLTLHPDNIHYHSHLDLLREEVALFVKPDPESERFIAKLSRALDENYGVDPIVTTVSDGGPNARLVTFRRRVE